MVTEAQQTQAEIVEAFIELVTGGWADDCTVRTTPVTSSDMVAGTVTEGAPVDVAAHCALFGITEQNFPGALIEENDKLALLDAEANIEDVIIIDSVEWTVINVKHVQPGPTHLISKAQVRR